MDIAKELLQARCNLL